MPAATTPMPACLGEDLAPGAPASTHFPPGDQSPKAPKDFGHFFRTWHLRNSSGPPFWVRICHIFFWHFFPCSLPPTLGVWGSVLPPVCLHSINPRGPACQGILQCLTCLMACLLLRGIFTLWHKPFFWHFIGIFEDFLVISSFHDSPQVHPCCQNNSFHHWRA